MENAVQEITTMIGKLSCNSGELTDYECLLAMLVNMKPNNLRQVIQNCDIMQLFMAMNLHESKSMEIALRLASTLFSVIPLSELVRKHLPEVLQALDSDKDELIEFVLAKLKDGVCEREFSISVLPDELLQAVVKLLVHENLAVYKAATKFLVAVVSRDPDGMKKVFDPKMSQSFTELCTSSSNKLRIAEMLISVAIQNPTCIPVLEASGLLQLLPEGLLDKDPLTNLNFIQLAKALTVLPEGYSWLENRGLLYQLSVRLRELNQDAFGNLLLPGYLAFFGCVARQHPVVWIPVDASNGDPGLVSVLGAAVESSDPSTSLAAMESAGHIALSIEGRKLLRTHLAPTGRLKLILVKLGRLVQNSETFTLVRALDCAAEFLHQPPVIPNTPDSVEQAQIGLEWAAVIGQPEDANPTGIHSMRSAKSLLKRLTSLATNPFPDMRLAALKVICSVSTQPWGVRLFLDQPGCMEYLLNRNTEVGLPDAAQLMHVKFEIIQSILTTMDLYKACEVPEFLIHVRPEQLACLKLYVKEGVWGTQSAQATIAMQSG